MRFDLLRYHQWCISDDVVMAAHEKAIRQTVKPGDIVLDIGAGTGILSFRACAAGAKRVYAIDPADIVAVVPEAAKANGCADRIVVRKEDSLQTQLPEKGDVLIASMLPAGGIGNEMIAVIVDARKRLLKPEGAVIPQGIRASFCPVQLDDWYGSRIDCWNRDHQGFQFHSIRPYAVNKIGAINPEVSDLLSEPAALEEIRLDQVSSPNVGGTLEFKIQRAGILHGIAGWTDLTMARGVNLSNSPFESSRSWDNMMLPVESPVPVQVGDTIVANIRATAMGASTILSWSVLVREADGKTRAEFHHSTFQGLFLLKADLERNAPASSPKLTPRGRAELLALSLCDGKHSIGDISETLSQAFPEQFENSQQAKSFAVEILNSLRTA